MDGLTELKDKAREVYESLHYNIQPRYPYALVWVLPKSQKIGEIYVPDKSNKPVYEGLVLRTHKSFYKYGKLPGHFPEGTDAVLRYQVLVSSELNPGDHILFQHFQGIPVPALDGGVGDYRLIDEKEIYATLEYGKDSTKDKIRRILESHYAPDTDNKDGFANDLMERADVIFHQEPKTTSGA